MRISIDLGHPAHVHYFRNFIKIMQEKGHEISITARDKEVTFKLLQLFQIQYISRGKGGNSLIEKFLYLLAGDWRVYREARKFKPDLFLSFASPYAAHASFFLRKPHIAFDDTEVAKFGQFFYLPFTKVCVNPVSFKKTFKNKQILFNGFMELCYLHPRFFSPNPNILKELLVNSEKPYVLLRFVSWNANHDIRQHGLSYENKKELINFLKEKYTVFISSEGNLPAEFAKYAIKISPDKIHHVMAFAYLFIGEGATMASECAMLGTPAIYVNSITAGTLEEQEKYNLLFGFRNGDHVLKKVDEILHQTNVKEEFQKRRQEMLSEKIDVTAFMVWFIENYPESAKIMKTNPDYQLRFK